MNALMIFRILFNLVLKLDLNNVNKIIMKIDTKVKQNRPICHLMIIGFNNGVILWS